MLINEVFIWHERYGFSVINRTEHHTAGFESTKLHYISLFLFSIKGDFLFIMRDFGD